MSRKDIPAFPAEDPAARGQETAMPEETAAPETNGPTDLQTEAETAEAIDQNEDAIPAEEAEDAEDVENVEDTQDEEDKEEPDDVNVPLCRRCMEQPVEEGEWYCAACAEEMQKIRIPIYGWIGGFLVLIAAAAALVSAFLNSAPALQVARAEASANKGNWMIAYKQYRKADEVVYRVDQILDEDGTPTIFIKIGSAVRARQAEAALRGYNPVDAYDFLMSYFPTAEAQKRCPIAAEILEEYEIYDAAYALIEDPALALINGEATAQEVNAQLEALRDQVSPVYVDYFLAVLTEYYDCTDEEALARYQKLDETAKASGREYYWLYYERYLNTLQNQGQYEQALALAEEYLQKDPSNLTMLGKKIKLALLMDKEDVAEEAYKALSDLYGSTDAQAIATELLMLRFRGEFEKAETLVTDAIESADTDTAVELHRQMALIYLLQEDYNKAFDEAYEANYNAYYVYEYYGDDSLYSDELDNTLYVCAYLCQLYGDGSAEFADKISEVLASYAGADKHFSAQTRAITSGEKTVQQVLTEGVYDLA
ncbi:MAG: hypothetical protein IK080_06440 [Clostridia bacterium]|nr:hypothetical protein [Clostridia bacterium]